MLRVLTRTAQAILLAIAGYNAVVALWGWKNRTPAEVGARRRHLRVVIPAHNEESVIAGILGDLGSDPYPAAEVVVLADRCTDSTVTMAVDSGALVAERTEGGGGKGAALSWYLEEHPLVDDEALVVFDADNRIPADALSRIADEFDAGHDIVQCYLDVENPDGSRSRRRPPCPIGPATAWFNSRGTTSGGRATSEVPGWRSPAKPSTASAVSEHP